MKGLNYKIKNRLRPWMTWHIPDHNPPLILGSIPRGGSTWMMELLGSVDGMRMIAEPFNLRVPAIKVASGISDWGSLVDVSMFKKLSAYLDSIDGNELKFLNPNPFVQMRFVTRRTLFKCIHMPIHLLVEIAKNMDAQIIILVRHPIPVSCSREVFPLLDTFSSSPMREAFTRSELALTDRVVKSGTHLEKGVVAWCLHFSAFLNNRKNYNYAPLVAYEHAVLEPENLVCKIGEILDLKFEGDLRKLVERPSRVLSKSDAQTQEVLKASGGEPSRKDYLVSRWVTKTSPEARKSIQGILDTFNVVYYNANDPMPRR